MKLSDHKTLGTLYLLTSALFIFVAFVFMLLLRWQLAFPGAPLPFLSFLGDARMPGGILLPEFYNQLGAMHGSVMIFLGVVPLGVAGFGHWILPAQIGATRFAFPSLSVWGFLLYIGAGVLMLSSFFWPGGAPQAGWTSYTPLASIMSSGQNAWLIGMILISVSTLLTSVNFLATIAHLRKKSLALIQLPFFVCAQAAASFLLLLAFPALTVASLLQLSDRVLDTAFFSPSGLVIAGQLAASQGNGSPLLYQHLFWFLAHPEVYVLILPALGIVAAVIETHIDRPLHGAKSMVYSTIFLTVLSFLVWAHHMFLTGMGPEMSLFFQFTTMMVSIPSVVIITSLLLSLWRARMRFSTPMLFALAFLPMFGIGGLTGIPLGLAASNVHLHDTYYVIAHFHYLVAPGALFALFAGIYYWFPKITGKTLNETLGQIHFWPSLLFMNGVFLPMFLMGIAGVSRRLWNPTEYSHALSTQPLNVVSSVSAWCLMLAQLPFLMNLILSCIKRGPAENNPWKSASPEWAQVASEPTPESLWNAKRMATALVAMWLVMLAASGLTVAAYFWISGSRPWA